MTLTRIARPAALAFMAAAAAGGCDRAAGPRVATTARDTGSGSAPALMAVGSPGVVPGQAAEAFAKDFLKAVDDGAATPDRLTPAFKKLVAPPVFGSDEAVGYSDAAAADWLARLKGKLPAPALGSPVGSGDAVGFVAGGSDTVTLRVVRADGAWRADWLFVTPASVIGPPPAGEAAFVATAFLQAVIAPADRLAAALMTPTLREQLAPPFGSDKGGYNAGILAHKLADLRGGATGFKITSATADAVTATPTGPGKPITLAVAGGKIDGWKTD